jgi:hypothetical protein
MLCSSLRRDLESLNPCLKFSDRTVPAFCVSCLRPALVISMHIPLIAVIKTHHHIPMTMKLYLTSLNQILQSFRLLRSPFAVVAVLYDKRPLSRDRNAPTQSKRTNIHFKLPYHIILNKQIHFNSTNEDVGMCVLLCPLSRPHSDPAMH